MERQVATTTKWSDEAFLNSLRDNSDPLANACARDLPMDQSLAFLFTKMRTDADLPPETEFPDAFATFLRQARPSLELDDLTPEEQAQLRRGQQVFLTNALPCALVLLSKSLQEGYQAPRLSKVLMMTGELESHTYRRVLGVLQMLVKVATPGSFEPKLASPLLPSSDSGLEAIKVRLMHAGLRGIAKRKFPDFSLQLGGEPISYEDMLATLMAFSVLVFDGLDILRVSLSKEDAEAYHFVWCVYARTMGIHPPGQPKSWDCVPRTVAEAREFYDTYKRRHYRSAAENPAGVALANANLRMLSHRMPPFAARIYMRRLIGDEASQALGIKPVLFLFLFKAIVLNFPRVWVWLWRAIDRRKGGVAHHEELTRFVLQGLIVMQYEAGVPSYRVPRDLDDVTRVVEGTQPGLNVGSDQFRREVFPVELRDIVTRREALGLDATPLKASGPPRAARGLIGLALSGGGIRSATFALGAVQALARRGGLKFVDYLSTVSGGGYTGAALSSLLNDADAGLEGQAFPLNFETGAVESPALRHLRSGANYLTGGGPMNALRLPAILLRGLLLNMVLILPYIMLAALATFVLFPFVHESGTIERLFWASLTLLSLLIVSYPIVSWFRGQHLTWDQRNWSENLLALLLLLFVIALLASMLSTPVTDAITTNWMHAKAFLMDQIVHPVDAVDAWKWALLAAVLYGAIRANKVAESASKMTSRVFLYVIGSTAPVAVFGTYLLLLVLFARSPYLDIRKKHELDRAALVEGVIRDTTLLDDLSSDGMAVDTSSRVTLDTIAGAPAWTIHAGAEHAYPMVDTAGELKMGGVDFGRGVARRAALAKSTATVDPSKQDSILLALLQRVDPKPFAAPGDLAVMEQLNALGVMADTRSAVTHDRASDVWAIGPNRAGATYHIARRVASDTVPAYGARAWIAIARSRKGLILDDADVGPMARFQSLLPDTPHHAFALAPAVLSAMRERGASLDSAVKIRFYATDRRWMVYSSTAKDYLITLEGSAAMAGDGRYLFVHDIGFGTALADKWFAGITLALLLLNLVWMNVNITSPHGYWRDRLSRVFLIRARWFGRPVPNDSVLLSELGTINPAVPYHLINTSLNLAASRVEDLPGRGSDFFIFSRRYTGSYATGFCRTELMEQADRHINLGTAMAISSAAVAPNAGTVTVKPLVPMLTILNVRQDYWAPNPWFVQATNIVRRLQAKLLTPGPKYLFREALGLLHARGPFVNLSDGGHVENLGVYELMRRRCKVIVAVDAEHDPTMSCTSLATLIRYARIDLGIEVDINLDPLNLDQTGMTERHWTVGTIRYGAAETGYLLYVKSSMTGDEAPYVKDYRHQNPGFPQESTADQFFTEAQFESYRALGYHALNGALAAAASLDVGDGRHGSTEALAALRDALGLGGVPR